MDKQKTLIAPWDGEQLRSRDNQKIGDGEIVNDSGNIDDGEIFDDPKEMKEVEEQDKITDLIQDDKQANIELNPCNVVSVWNERKTTNL